LPSLLRAWTIAAPVQISLFHVLALIPVAATAASIGYCVLGIVAGLRFAARRDTVLPSPENLPRVSILKPLKGTDPEMYDALRSHCVQEYTDYEILCGVTDASDPAVPIVERMIAEFPQAKIRLVLCGKRLGANGKVSSLIQLVELAETEYLLVNDSDICVGRDYLRTVITELQQPNTGLVTCLYRGVAGGTVGSRLEALGISTDFMPGVLAANLIERGIHFGLGSTLAFRKSDLAAIGGFEAIVNHLADDYELGQRISRSKKVRLSRSVVETHLAAYDVAGFIAHQFRWARTIRASRPAGYAGLLLTFTLPWAIAALCVSRGTLGWVLFGLALLSRSALAYVGSQVVLRERNSVSLWLLPLRDLVAVAVWFGGLFGSTILWRGERFVLRNGLLVRK
jgi:ceramide glucosyltransferase